ncbi:mechanosensitive ion channel family protein [Methanoregula formicica]|uniref:Small-conductance mechanosensitive channel n=1 Tax=Methanoregula formicica (strain DSM 22288 / NBRC 105244 / SMSP) TaxID=593750 RepID=L0HEN8_METFS|nr:mechanosensitive ion channel domain-containing protein [Methanoregula formicica]AGB01778.1 small-conductance mechanosensitive channel [Methanoregula formicica SMSP]
MLENIIFAAITIVVGFVIAGIAWGIIWWLKKKAEQTTTHLDDIILNAVGTPLVIWIVLISIYIALTQYDIVPSTLGRFSTGQIINAVFILLAAWAVSVFLSNLIRTYGTLLAERTEADLDRIIQILLIIVKYVIWFVVFLILLHTFEIDITALLAAAGIAGIAVALAAQDIIGNFFAGIVIAFDKPFRLGDRVRIDTFFGDVVRLGARSTRIRTMDSQIVTIPNTTVTSNVVTNYSMPDTTLKVRIPFSVAYGTDMDKVTEILLSIARDAVEKTPWVLSEPAPAVFLREFGESALNGQLTLWINDFSLQWETEDWINREILSRFQREGIEMPFRQIDIRVRETKE